MNSRGLEQELTRRCEVWPGLPRRLSLAPLGPSVLEPDLDARLAELQLARELLAREHVRVRGALEGALQLLQLVSGERGASLLLLRSLCLLPLLLSLAPA